MRNPGRYVVVLAAYLWAGPWTLLGLTLGAAALATGGAVRRRAGVLEFYGGACGWLLAATPVGAAAMTLGHTVLGRSAAVLDLCRSHELVHVRQYERWGLFFVPAYLACSLALWLAGKRAYLDNPFEREAFEKA